MSPLPQGIPFSHSPSPSESRGPRRPARAAVWPQWGAALAAVALAAACAHAPEDDAVMHWVYVGTGAQHIYVAAFDDATGEIGEPRKAAAIGRPGFLALHPTKDVLYAVGREREGESSWRGEAAAFSLDRETGDLSEINRAPTNGNGAAHVAVHPAGGAIAACNYGDGNTVSLTLRSDGSLGSLVSDEAHSGSSAHPTRQGEPHPHSVNFTPDGKILIVPDLGTDELVAYSFDAGTAALERTPDQQLRMAPGSGPRHLTFHPAGRWAYVINELASTVTALEYEAATGGFEVLQTIGTLPEDYDGPVNSTAEVLVHPSGKFLYGSNRGDNSIAVFSIADSDGRLAFVERTSTGGDWPRNFKLSPSGAFLLAANQRSDDVRVFRVDGATGRLEPTGASVSVPNPMCVRFVPGA